MKERLVVCDAANIDNGRMTIDHLLERSQEVDVLVRRVRRSLHNAGDDLPARPVMPRVLIAALSIRHRVPTVRIRQRIRSDRDAKRRVLRRQLKNGLSREDVNDTNRRRVATKSEVSMPKINRTPGGALVARYVRGGDVA